MAQYELTPDRLAQEREWAPYRDAVLTIMNARGMKLSDVARELGIPTHRSDRSQYQRFYGAVRNGRLPEAYLAQKIKSWCKKHAPKPTKKTMK